MAHHLYLERVWEATQKDLTFPRAEYHGFAIGPQSDLGVVRLVDGLGGGLPRPIEIPAGSVIPCEPFVGQPVIGHLNKLGPYGVPILNRLHVIGLTKPWELACAIQRAPDRGQWLETTKGAGGTTTWLVAFHNRQHGLFIINSSAIVTLGIYGRSYSTLLPVGPTPGRVALQTGIALAVGDNAIHVGGTDHEEPFDTLELEFTGANASDLKSISHVGGEFRR